jgi:hypothetical protein
MRKYLLFLISILLCQNITAQSTGKIAGRITDKQNNEPIPFANVFVEGTTLGAAANDEGDYSILNVPPGVYTVTASVVGISETICIRRKGKCRFYHTIKFSAFHRSL